MLIANPIYDAVFKYLMDDNKVAKLLLSAIIGEKITKLEYRPTEVRSENKEKCLTVYHIDFVAQIQAEDGTSKLVIIEIQKAKFSTDIIRFRRYLGQQYSNPENFQMVREEQVPYSKPLPIVSIYFLGHKLEHIKAPVIKVQREYIDLTSGNTIKAKEQFIESLTHDSFVIQIPWLKQNRKTELLRILSIFDQSCREKDYHILNVNENDFPEHYGEIIRRLQRANADKTLRNSMSAEDTYFGYLEDTERYIEQMKENIVNKEKLLEEKDKLLEENQKHIEEKDKLLKEKDKIIEELKRRFSTI